MPEIPNANAQTKQDIVDVVTNSSEWAEINILGKYYGIVADGITDDTIALQSALDANEGGILLLPIGIIKIAGTIYIGNVHLIGHGMTRTIIRISMNGSWTEKGSATRKSVGCIITKSSLNAGYGLAFVSPYISNLSIEYNVTAANNYPTVLQLENISGGEINSIQIYTSGTTTYNCNPFDVYYAVRDFEIKGSYFNMSDRTSTTTGGCWIRNYNNTTPTENILVSHCTFDTGTTDESFAIMNSTSTSSVRNITVQSCYFRNRNTIGGAGISVLKNFDVNETLFGNISINDCVSIVDKAKIGAWAFKTKDSATNFNTCTAIIKDNTSTSSYGFEYLENSAWIHRKLPSCYNCLSLIDSPGLTVNVHYGFAGLFNLFFCETNAIGGGSIRIGAYGVNNIIGGRIAGVNFYAFRYGNSISDCEVRGPIGEVARISNCYMPITTAFSVTGTGISFASNNTINITGDEFLGLLAGDSITVTGSVSNNATYTIATVTYNQITTTQTSIITENAGANITIARAAGTITFSSVITEILQDCQGSVFICSDCSIELFGNESIQPFSLSTPKTTMITNVQVKHYGAAPVEDIDTIPKNVGCLNYIWYDAQNAAPTWTRKSFTVDIPFVANDNRS